MENYTPVILDEFVPVIEWARELYKKHMTVNTVIEYLTNNKKVRCDDDLREGLIESRKLYDKYNSAHRSQLLKALIVDEYRLFYDIKLGQIVTNDTYVGYAYQIDYKRRVFNLYSSVFFRNYNLIGEFSMGEFRKV